MNDRSEEWRPALRAVRAAKLPAGLAADGVPLKILGAALRLFATHGFHGASIRDIVSLVELQASAVYAHFPSKEHILAELTRAGHEAHFNALQSALLEEEDPALQLAAFVRTNAIFHVTHPHLAIVVNTEMYALSDELAAPALALRRQTTALLLRILERGERMGRFAMPSAHVRNIAAAAIGAMAVRTPYWYGPETGFEASELAEGQVALALRMVGAEGAR